MAVICFISIDLMCANMSVMGLGAAHSYSIPYQSTKGQAK